MLFGTFFYVFLVVWQNHGLDIYDLLKGEVSPVLVAG